MQEKIYPVAFEVAGAAAMFTRPDTGSSPVSYPVPTRTALKGMFESVCFAEGAYFEPQKVEICTPIVYHKYTTNYQGPLKKTGTTNFQIFATVLENVCYKVYGRINVSTWPSPAAPSARLSRGVNRQHALQEMFMRRLRVGSFYSTPFLGWKEFTPSYFGILRDSTSADVSIDVEIPLFLDTMYDRPTYGVIAPTYREDISIKKGVFYYAC
jgi:CRISPR-associated protein Cas5d